MDAIARGQIVSRYITAAPSEAAELLKHHPDVIDAGARGSRAEWLDVPAEWRDYAHQYGPDEALQRAREAGGFGVSS
jgi:hypothetical protein